MTVLRLLVVTSLLVLSGCGGIERLPDVPEGATLTKVKPYTLDTYQRSIHRFEPVSVTQRAQALMLQQRINNLLVLYVEPEAGAEYRGIPKSIFAQEVFRRFNMTVPHLPLKGGVWTLGESKQGNFKKAYQSLHLQHALDKSFVLPQVGATTVSGAIDLLSDYASLSKGRTGLLLLLDWEQIDESVVDAVARFRQRGEYAKGFEVVPDIDDWQSTSERTCVFAIGVGNAYSRTLLDQVDKCGESASADQIAQPRDMAHFVEKIFYTVPKDSDEDGIFDYADKCPQTPADRIVDRFGCLRFGGEG